MKVIFLDVDGVLNSSQFASEMYDKTGRNGFGGWFKEEEPIDHDNVLWSQELVDRVRRIADTCSAKIVMSSTWRKHFSVPKFKEMFSIYGWDDAPVIDKTVSLRGPRGLEINDWLSKNKHDAYVILDDSRDMLPDQMSHFVETDMEIGISDEDVEKAIKILNNEL